MAASGSDTDDKRPYSDDANERGVDLDRRGGGDVGVDAARARFGGMHIGAQLVGMLAALALVVLLGGLVGAAIGGIAYQTGLDASAREISVGSLVSGFVVLVVSFLIGGWAAGRMARYDGRINGLMSAVWFFVLGAILAGLGIWLGSEYNVADRVDMPDWFGTWFNRDTVTTGAFVSGVLAILLILGSGYLGGWLGERMHRRADETIVAHRSGGIAGGRRVLRSERSPDDI
jgi:hypothetical protein